MAHYGPTNPPEEKGFTCYCEECGTYYTSHHADPETGLIYCSCGEDFKPEE